VKRLVALGACVALGTVVACGSRPSISEAAHGSLGRDVVARVGQVELTKSLVSSVASAQKLSPASALGLLVDDALAAAGAQRDGLDKTPEVTRAVTAAHARGVVLEIREAARDAGPPTDDEVNEVTEAHWAEVDLPERFRVIHAVVLTPKDPAREAEAKALASAIALAEAKAVDEDDFEARAKGVPSGGLEVKVERLDPFVADGRFPKGGSVVPEFSGPASKLAVGATSGVVATKFGWHVIRMIERLGEHRVPFEERRRIFREEVIARRARRALDKLEEHLVAKYPVSIANGVEQLMTDATMKYLTDLRSRDLPTP
jgi:parvulin-like peptidyl-prolyl isomerase